MLANYSDVVDHLKAGKLRALATATRTRIASLPEVPTVDQSGYEGYHLDVWVGVLAPRKLQTMRPRNSRTGSPPQ